MLVQSLRKRSFIGLLMCVLMMPLHGCIYLVVGSVGALGGYVISPDTVEGIIGGKEMADVWDAAVEAVSMVGIIEEEDETAGILIAKTQGTKVTIMIVPAGVSTCKLTVKARKAFLPRIKVAQDVYVRIETFLYGGE